MSRYGAFLSYSRQNLVFARRLHAALESYRIPKNAGQSEVTERPDRIAPLFRDQDEVSASSNLDETLKLALEQSAALIVIASQEAAKSKWVNAEIEEFIRLGRASRIFVAIPPETPQERSFQITTILPPALLSTGEPLAADFRPNADGFTLAKLKLVSAVAAIDLVRLRDRDAQRRLRQTFIGGLASAFVVGVIGVAGFNWWQADQRARAERVARSIEAVRTNLQADQPGPALAFIDAMNQGDMKPDVRAAIARIRLFWRDQLTTPDQAISAIPVGSVYDVNGTSYFRGENGPMRMPVEGAQWVYQKEGSSHLFFADRSRSVYRVDAASGASSLVFNGAAEDFAINTVFERPDGTVIIYGSNTGATMAGQHDVAYVVYPDGRNSGVIQGRVQTELHADLSCTRIYYADGDKGYKEATPGAINPDFVQVLAQGPSQNARFPTFSFGVATLEPNASWREETFAPPSLGQYEEEAFAYDWLDGRGPPILQACHAYAFRQSFLFSSQIRIQAPALRTDLWRRDDTQSMTSLWSNLAWTNPSALPEGGVYQPQLFGQGEGGQFAIYESPSNFFSSYSICLQPNGQQTQCRETEVDGAMRIGYARTAQLMFADETIDLRTMTPLQGFAEDADYFASPDGRTLLTLSPGAINVHGYSWGAAPSSVRTFSIPEIAELEAALPLNADAAIVVTHEGRLLRIDTAAQRVMWSVRDRLVQQAIGSEPYIGPNPRRVQLVTSPNGLIGAIISHLGGIRLYELTLGIPLTPIFEFERGAVDDPVVEVSDDGAVVVRGRGRFDERGGGYMRAAPQPRDESADTACLYAARVSDGQLRPVEIFGDPAMMQRCGFAGAAPAN